MPHGRRLTGAKVSENLPQHVVDHCNGLAHGFGCVGLGQVGDALNRLQGVTDSVVHARNGLQAA